MKSPKDLSPRLKEALRLFVKELDEHIGAFEQHLGEEVEEPKSDSKNNILRLKNRFHLIKGGAGFFDLEEIQDTAAEGERLCEEPKSSEFLGRLEGLVEALSRQRKNFDDFEE